MFIFPNLAELAIQPSVIRIFGELERVASLRYRI